MKKEHEEFFAKQKVEADTQAKLNRQETVERERRQRDLDVFHSEHWQLSIAPGLGLVSRNLAYKSIDCMFDNRVVIQGGRLNCSFEVKYRLSSVALKFRLASHGESELTLIAQRTDYRQAPEFSVTVPYTNLNSEKISDAILGLIIKTQGG